MSKSPNPEQLTLNARASGFRRSKVLINSTTSAAVRLDMSDRSRLGGLGLARSRNKLPSREATRMSSCKPGNMNHSDKAALGPGHAQAATAATAAPAAVVVFVVVEEVEQQS